MINLQTIRTAKILLEHDAIIPLNSIPERLGGQSYLLSEVQELAQLQDSSRLSRADLWNALSRADELGLTPEVKEALRACFFYDADTNLDGVELQFHQAHYNSGQVAYLEISPQNIDRNLSPIVFVGGLHHPSRVYFETMRQLAINTHRRIFMVDSPGMGGSENVPRSAVTPQDLQNAISAVVNELESQQRFQLSNGEKSCRINGA